MSNFWRTLFCVATALGLGGCGSGAVPSSKAAGPQSPTQSEPAPTSSPQGSGSPTGTNSTSVTPDSGETSAQLAGRSFVRDGKTYVPADFQTVQLSLNFDVSDEKTTGTARIEFQPVGKGHPYFLMAPQVTSARLDGKDVSLEAVRDTDGQTTFRAVNTEVEDGASQVLELEYELPDSEVTYRSDGIGFVTSMADINDGNFFEAYGPANFEADQFQVTAELSLKGGSSEHRIFTNGSVVMEGSDQWKIEFPDYFTTSSFYMHLTNTDLAVHQTKYAGLEKEIPITIYSQDASLANQAFQRITSLFKELEGTYGPYEHASFTAYINGSGGMEHSGAAITSVSALGHELLHSWFARGVMPSDGRSGWVDEAIATWRDYGYSRASGVGDRSSVNLASFSPFELFTPFSAYAQGENLMSELDFLFRDQGGLKPVLKDFFAEWKKKTISTEIFRGFLEKRTGVSLESLFQDYVYGGQTPPEVQALQAFQEPEDAEHQIPKGLHPPALTREDVLKLR